MTQCVGETVYLKIGEIATGDNVGNQWMRFSSKNR